MSSPMLHKTSDGTYGYIARMPELVEKLPAGLYDPEYGQEGPVIIPLKQRSDTLFVFKNGPMPVVRGEIKKFWAAKSKYAGLGRTHRRGILLYGGAGNGKSGIMGTVIKEHVQNDGVVFKFGFRGGEMACIKAFRRAEPNRPMLLITEDLDNECSSDTHILEALDGTTDTFGQGVLFIATTNNLDDIPPRIRDRKSRIDTVIDVPAPNVAQRLEYLTSIKAPKAAELAKKTNGFSLAALGEVILLIETQDLTVTEAVRRCKPVLA